MNTITFNATLCRYNSGPRPHICRGQAKAKLPYLPSYKMKIGDFTMGVVEALPDGTFIVNFGIEDIVIEDGRSSYDMAAMQKHVETGLIPGLFWTFEAK